MIGKGHPKQKDPQAKNPHSHRVELDGSHATDKNGNPHLPDKPGSISTKQKTKTPNHSKTKPREEMTIKTAEKKSKKIRELEIARNMKLAGMTMGVIKQMVGLSEDEINKL